MKKFRATMAAGTKRLELFLYDEIGPDWLGMVSAETVLRALEEADDPEEIVLRINSPGGSVFDGQGIYSALHKHPARVVVEIDGLAASAASFVAMVGERIVIAQHGLMMVHNPWTISWGEADDHRKTAEMLDQVKDSILSIYAARTGLSSKRLSTMLDQETWFGADEALEHGFADEVLANQTPENAYNFDPSRHQWQNAPAALKPREPQPSRLAIAKRKLQFPR